MTYDFDTPVDRRGTWCVQWDGITDRFPVADLLPFTISDMDFRSPPQVLDALESRIAHGVFGYTDWRNDDFRGAIRDWFRDRHATEVDVDRLVYAPSVLNQIAQLLRMWTAPGDGVVAHAPTYDGLRKAVTGLGRELRTVGLDDWAGLEREMARPDSRALFLCSPHNPTGHVWTDTELRRIAELARAHDVAVVSDEIHADLTHDGHTHLPWSRYGGHDGRDGRDGAGLRWALVTSGTKSFNFPALSGSYGFVGDPDDHAEFVRRMDTAEGLASPAVLSLTAHIAAYRHGGDWLDGLRAYTYGNLRMLEERLDAAFPELRWRVPEAGYLAWVDLRPLGIREDTELQRVLVEEEKVAVMPGGTYGAPGFVRLNLGCPRSKAETGADALVRAVRKVADRAAG
ncbi:aminotransferase class I/II-fold pyridoxal phosphate-dependent enzyme [Streptomyces sp. SID8379]|uniref:MalY/PatB family protein n=1 Tax=unclassified Streptomyces TaxID=2593676 RepID=UPI00036AE173|nr:aminotransferase class I/II-fold pyridoxal phosphate-dependent enzyme [Streptomyces sp. HmicA12]MYW68727.1 aminotransferase class I/II-fold pyridoxal phosphate-dependent enzyme [Streptomyces sp. SID8379]